MAAIITLLLVGAALLLLETLLPGWIAGIAGIVCLFAATALAYTNLGTQTGHLVLGVVLVGLIAGTLCWMKYFPDSRIARRFISRRTVGTVRAERPDLLHQTGTALTPLRPSGAALINHQRVDVVTEGQMVGRGDPIRVVGIEGMRVIVRPVVDGSVSPRS